MFSKRVCLCWLLLGLVFFAVVSGGCGGGSSSGSGSASGEKYTGNNTVSYTALAGTWTGSGGSGSGQNNKYLPGQRVSVKVESLEYKIRNIKYSESSKTGTAELSLKENVTNEQYGVNSNRDWGGDFDTFTMTNTGRNSWTFSNEYSDGEDNITLTLQSESSGTIRNVGYLQNEDDPSDKTEFDFTCSVTKTESASPSPDNPNDPDEPNEPVEYVDWTKYSGTWTPDSNIADITTFDNVNYPEDNSKMVEFKLISSTNIVLSISPTANEGEYNVTFSGTLEYEKTNADGYTCSRNSYDMSEANGIYSVSSEYQGLHIKNATSSGLFVSIFDWEDDTIDVIFIDEHNSVTSENGVSISSEATASFVGRRAAN